MQSSYDAYFCVVDLHAITVPQDPAKLANQTLRTAAQFLACGVSATQSTLFIQSHVSAHSELSWILNTIAGFGELSRMTQFKNKASKNGAADATVGLFTYPILQAADILLYDSDVVPVGEDQRQHLELARDIAERFNQRFGETFVLPRAKILEREAKIYDLQQPELKMSKSANSSKGVLWLLDEPDVISKKIGSAVTDSENVIRFDELHKPGVSNLLTIGSIATGMSIASLEDQLAGAGYGKLKALVQDALIEHLKHIREKTNALMNDPAELDRLLSEGSRKARDCASVTLSRVRSAVGFLASSSSLQDS